MQGVDFPFIANNSNMTNMLQKSIAVTIALLEQTGQSAGQGALLSPGTPPGSSTANKFHQREA